MQTLFLVGIMGSGKSYWGKKLAEKLAIKLVDLDDAIEHHEGQTIAEIFNRKGEDYFRQVETICLQKLAEGGGKIVSCGGGTPCFNNNMEFMKRHGLVVWLNPPTNVLVQRIWPNKEKRPLIADAANTFEVAQRLEKLMAGRRQFYEQAHFTIAAEHIDIEELVNKIKVGS